MLRRDELVLASIVEVTARWWAWTHATAWTGSSRLPTDKRDHQARCASSAARTGATSPTCGATTIAARPHLAREAAPQPVPRRYPPCGEPSYPPPQIGAERRERRVGENCWNAAFFVKQV